ncbi:MAG: sulfurtransferase complex subunit TusD [Buchnera aphidicola (Ceratovacuna japonica)]
MKYTILVTSSFYETQSSISSFLFVKNLILKKHIIKSIFFYSNGVYNSNIISHPYNNRANLLKYWKKLHHKFDIKLKICIGSSFKRGIITEDLSYNKGICTKNIDSSFKISSFSELAKDIISSDRLVQF